MSESTHRALHVIHYPFYGGPQNQVLRLAAPLSRRGWDTVAVLPDDPGDAADRLIAGGIDVEVIKLGRLRARTRPKSHLRFLAGFWSDVNRLRGLIKRLRINVVIATSMVNLQGQLAGHFEDVPVITQLLDSRTPMMLRRALMPLVMRLSDVVMTTGLGIADVHPGARQIGRRLIPFYPPVDTACFRPDTATRTAARQRLGIPADAFVAGTVANMTPQKGLEWFARATGELVRRHPEVHVVLLSGLMNTQAHYARAVEREFADQGMLDSPRLHWIDPGRDVPHLIGAVDVFLMTSVPRSEGVSTTVLEAMSAGIPVVSTDVGALAEVVENGVSGFVIPPLNVDAIVQAIEELYRDVPLAKAMGAEGRRRAVALYDVEACADTYIRAIQAAIDHAAPRRLGSRA